MTEGSAGGGEDASSAPNRTEEGDGTATCEGSVSCEAEAPPDGELPLGYTLDTTDLKHAKASLGGKGANTTKDDEENSDDPGVIIWHCTELGEGSPGDPGEPGTEVETDDNGATHRLNEALTNATDPDGTHTGTDTASGHESMSNLGTITGIGVGLGWADGDREGHVALSIATEAGPYADDCNDPDNVNGPAVTCEERTLADGTVVSVGRGTQGGAERIAVQYQRPDGVIVWATADAATEAWWEDGSGPGPLASPPATVDQLITLVLDDSLHSDARRSHEASQIRVRTVGQVRMRILSMSPLK